MKLLTPLLLAGALVAASCGGSGGGASASDDASADSDRLVLATTVAPITSLASQIVGDRAEVVGIVPEGTNSHTYEPKPSVAELLSRADLIFVNGLKLEEPTVELAEANMRDDAEIIELGTIALPEADYIYDFSFPESEGKPNPHLWTDPSYALQYTEIIRDRVTAADPENADYYAANYEAFAALIDEFDAAMRESFATIPEGSKKLLTYHDAYAYFAKNYGWEVIGAIQVSDFEDPTAKELADLIDQVRAEGVQAIFGSEVFPSPVLEQIGQEAGVTYVDVLRDDDLPGEPGDAEHSWLGLMVFDYLTMTDALGGDSSAIAALDVRNVAPDEATYPQ
ncbi:MAG: metal ABC transporter substrate-binding protein [Acidimicrobiales bacterium]